MIRRSIFVAVVAIALSLGFHGLGLNLASRGVEPQPDGQGEVEQPDVGGSFADVAEPAEQPAAPDVIQPEPITSEIPPTNALVASDTPQSVTTPDTGTAQEVSPLTPEPSDVLAALPAPVDQPSEPVETVESEPAEEVTEPQEVFEPAEAETDEDSPPPDAPEIETTTEDEAILNAAVTRSLRPPKQRPTQDRTETEDQTRTAAGTIQQSGLELLSRPGASLRIGNTTFGGARAAGNSTTTNYAGRVLVQLNRSPKLNTAAKGTARVLFEISPDGSIAWVRVLSSTGSPGIVRAAAAQVRSAAPFPRTPDGTPQRLSFTYRSR